MPSVALHSCGQDALEGVDPFGRQRPQGHLWRCLGRAVMGSACDLALELGIPGGAGARPQMSVIQRKPSTQQREPLVPKLCPSLLPHLTLWCWCALDSSRREHPHPHTGQLSALQFPGQGFGGTLASAWSWVAGLLSLAAVDIPVSPLC